MDWLLWLFLKRANVLRVIFLSAFEIEAMQHKLHQATITTAVAVAMGNNALIPYMLPCDSPTYIPKGYKIMHT